jgi:hypothetical protein
MLASNVNEALKASDVRYANHGRALLRNRGAIALNVEQIGPLKTSGRTDQVGVTACAAGEPYLVVVAPPNAQARTGVTVRRTHCEVTPVLLLRHLSEPCEELYELHFLPFLGVR